MDVSNSIAHLLRSTDLPTLPEVALRVLEITQQPDPDMEELVQAIKSDPAIATRILKTANSALFGLRYGASSIESAVPLLGLNLVRMLVMGFCLTAVRTSGSATMKPWYQLLWKQSLIQAATAETLAHHVSNADPANWFLAGLLQDTGRLAMLSANEETYVLEVLSSLDDQPLENQERDTFGFTHTDISMSLCRLWQMDDEFVDAIATHHDSCECVIAGDWGSATLAIALKTAALVVDYFEQVVTDRLCDRSLLDRLLMLVFGLTPDEVTETLADIDARVGQIAGMFAVDIGSNRSLERILEEAQEQLCDIAIGNQLRIVMPASADQQESHSPLNLNEGQERQNWQDSLTGVFTRATLTAASTQFEQTQRRGMDSAVLLAKVDNCQTLNLSHGNSFGDEALRRVACVLRQAIRPQDYLIRYSCDEFLIVLPEMTADLLSRIARRLNDKIAGIHLSCTEDIVVSASIGAVACCTDRKITPLNTVIVETQRAVQKARSLGMNQVAVFTRKGGKLHPHRWPAMATASH